MNRIISSSILLFITSFLSFHATAQAYDHYPVYTGSDLGVSYTHSQTTFKVWAPTASEVTLRLYKDGIGGSPLSVVYMDKAADGVWQYTIGRDLKNNYYTFQAAQDGKLLQEKPDIYARAVGANGLRGMVVDLSSTNPPHWSADKKPPLNTFTDIILYETHVRDISVSPNSGIQHKGKFLGLAETGTKSPQGVATGIDHIRELGVTHIHLLPSFDFNSIDETRPASHAYNWGYDPLNYNVPEGSYATDAYDGNVRIREFKEMVQAMHANGLRVVLDVVYNHTCDLHAGFNEFAPGYFYRHKADGSYSDATGCGNETASEKEMMRAFMIASVVYWAKEYHIDGFRFDLMATHDIETMNQVSEALHKVDPTIFIYGEGWTAGSSSYPEELRAAKKNAAKLHEIAVFNDDMRDGIKGSFSDVRSKGFVSGAMGNAENVKFGIVGAIPHTQVDYSKVSYDKAAWAAQPAQSINYVSCHDDNTLYDKLKIADPGTPEADLIKMDLLSNAIVLTAQGVPFLHCGAEMLRSKQGNGNSYNAPDSINQVDWSRLSTYRSVYDYYRGIIALRKAHPAFRMATAEMINHHLRFIDTHDDLLIAYQLAGHANNDKWKDILVVFNGGNADKTITLPPGHWKLAADGEGVYSTAIKTFSGSLPVGRISAVIVYRE